MWISRVTWPRALRWNKNRSGQTYLIPVFAGLLFAAIIRQNQPFRRGRRYLALFAAHIREYVPRKKRHFPCPRRKILFFRILPAPAIRLRFAPAEQRWLRLFFVRSPIYHGLRLVRCVCPPRGPDCRPRPPDETHARPADGNKLRPWPPGRNSAHARAAIPGRAAGHKSGFPGRWCAARRCRRAWWP